MTLEARIDKIDMLIINSLMQDGRKSFRQISKEIGFSTPTVESHFSKLMSSGIIKNIIPTFDLERVEHGISAFVFVRTANTAHTFSLAKKFAELKEVGSIYLITGKYNLVFKLIGETPENIEEIIRTRIASMKDIEYIYFQIVTRIIQEVQGLPIKEGLAIKLRCDYCNNEILKNSKVLQVGQYERQFCCSSCLTLYRQKYRRGIESVSK
jgi:DNA-binding Lrp family transcriptional regulator